MKTKAKDSRGICGSRQIKQKAYRFMLDSYQRDGCTSWDDTELLGQFGLEAIEYFVVDGLLIRLRSRENRYYLSATSRGTTAGMMLEAARGKTLEPDELLFLIKGPKRLRRWRLNRLLKYLEDFGFVETVVVLDKTYISATAGNALTAPGPMRVCQPIGKAERAR